MREMYYSSQPMEIQDLKAMEQTFRMVDAEKPPASTPPTIRTGTSTCRSTIYDPAVPLREGQAQPSLGGTAARLVQAKAAQREAEREFDQVRQLHSVKR